MKSLLIIVKLFVDFEPSYSEPAPFVSDLKTDDKRTATGRKETDHPVGH